MVELTMGRRLLTVAPNPSVDRPLDRDARSIPGRQRRRLPGGASVATLRGDDRRAVVVLGTAAAAASALVPGARRLEAVAVKRLCVEIAAERVG